MKRPDLRWRQQRKCEDNETSDKIGIETGMVISLLALLLGGLIVSLERNHQRKESKNDATGVRHQSRVKPKTHPSLTAWEVDTGYGLLDLEWLLDEGH